MNDDEAIPSSSPPRHQPWNKGKLMGAKPNTANKSCSTRN
jgi:hypothetical protein